ncbi:ABC transporter permease [Deltaproteobacteria bacterium]|nr:ABC transporter permease [Deltaproteobacteria bacterium]
MTGRERLVVAGSLAGGVLLWALVAHRAGPLLLPTPGAVLLALWDERLKLERAALETGIAALGGLAVASVFGVLAAAAAWWSRALRLAVLPYTVLVQIVPIVAIAPMLVVWLGYGRGVALSTAAIASFYPIYSAAQTGLVAPSTDLVDLYRLLGASRLQELLGLRAWAALPALFSGLRTAGGLAVIGAIVGEFIGSNGSPPTLGYTVLFASRSARSEVAFAAILVAGALALAIGAVTGWLERRWIGRWYGA